MECIITPLHYINIHSIPHDAKLRLNFDSGLSYGFAVCYLYAVFPP